MPELPEVETIRRGLSNKIVGKKIIDVKIVKTRLVRNNPQLFKKSVAQNIILSIDRIGKLLIFNLADNNSLLIHLKMTGQLIYAFEDELVAGGHNLPQIDNLPNKYSHIIFQFADGSNLFFNDMRQFGYMYLVSREDRDVISQKYGIEPGRADFTLANFRAIIKSRKGILKAFLLNQQFISGIGNIYADEICFRARVLPSRKVNSLSGEDIKALWQASGYIIKKAIAKQGTTFRNYRDADNNKGNFVKYLKVYGRAGQKCLTCRKIKIKKIKLAGRGTHFCPHCQK